MNIIVRGKDGESDRILGEAETESEARQILDDSDCAHMTLRKEGNWWLCEFADTLEIR